MILANNSRRNIRQISQRWSRMMSSMTFPNERYGVDYKTNWAVASCGVVPGDVAFRNPESKTLLAYSKKVDRASKTINRATEKTTLYSDMNAETFEEVLQDGQQSTTGTATFLIDAGAGSSLKSCTSVRCVTDSAEFAMALKTLLCQMPARGAENFKPDVFLVHSEKRDSASEGPYCAVRGNRIVCRGGVESSSVVQAIAVASASTLAASKRGLVLPGTFTVANGSVSISIGAAGFFVWGPSGVSRLFDGDVVKDAKANVQVAETSGKVVYTGAKDLSNVVPAPSKISFASGSVADAEAAKAAFAKASLTGGSEAELQMWDSLVASAKPSFA